jgi:hypothetical protein
MNRVGDAIYEVNGIPITFYEIQEWWDSAPNNIKTSLNINDEKCRYKIASLIVREIEHKFSDTQAELLKKHLINQKKEYDNLFTSHTSVLPKIVNNDYDHLNRINWDTDVSSYYGPNSLFRQALKLADEKLKQQEQKNKKFDNNRSKTYNQPPPKQPEPTKILWRQTLQITETIVNKELINKKFRELAKKCHPDFGGNENDMKKIIEARNQAYKEMGLE